MALILDPVVAHATASALASVFLLAGVEKLRDPALFLATVEDYQLLPAPVTSAFAWALPVAECVAAVLLFMADTRTAGALLAVLLLALVSGAIVVNLRRGRTKLACGCGMGTEMPIGAGLVVRNLILAGSALLLLLPMAPRATVWLDLLAALFLALFLVGLQAVATALLAHHARLLSLRKLP